MVAQVAAEAEKLAKYYSSSTFFQLKLENTSRES